MSNALTEVGRSATALYNGPIAQPAQFTQGVARHHKRSFDDYDVAKQLILQAVGDLSDLRLFGRQVACAVFCRPNVRQIRRPDGSVGALYSAIKVGVSWQHKVTLILKCGPGAFKGDASYIEDVYGDPSGIPKPGDWVFANASAGIQTSFAGAGASRPQNSRHERQSHGHLRVGRLAGPHHSRRSVSRIVGRRCVAGLMNRRGFIGGLIATLAAPAIIRTPGLLMPVKVPTGEGMTYLPLDYGTLENGIRPLS